MAARSKPRATTPKAASKPASSSRVSTYVALLRGINVGGKNMLPMRELVEIFGRAGCADVRSYIQSGNVVFAADAACAKTVPATVRKGIQKRFGFDPPIMIRSAGDLRAVIADNPFLAGRNPVDDIGTLHVAFLETAADRARVDALDPPYSPGETLAVRQSGRSEVYLHLTNGLGKSKLTNAWMDRALATVSTVRNWRTVTKLLEMCEAT